MKRLILLLLLIPTLAFAETLSWEPPTTYADGTPLNPLTDLSEYRLYCEDVVTVVPASSTDNQYVIKKYEALPGYGTWDCYLTAVGTDNLESEPSNTVAILYEKTGPAKPINLIILE